jgi:integrase
MGNKTVHTVLSFSTWENRTMPRIAGVAVPKYSKHKASGQAVVTIQQSDHYLGPYGSLASKVEYDRLIGEWLVAGRPTLPLPDPSAITVTAVIAAFWRYAKAHYRRHDRQTGSADNYKPVLALLRQRYGHTPAAKFGPLALKALQAAMVEANQSRRYVNDNVARIKRLFRWSASEELIPSSVPERLNNVDGLRKGLSDARETAPIQPVAEATVEATLGHLPRTVADMVRTQMLTGARPGEICVMRPGDIDRSGDVWKYKPAEHKTEHHGHQRVICIGPQAQAILRPYLLRQDHAYCFSPADSERKRRRDRHVRRTTPLGCGNRPGKNTRRRPRRSPGNRYTNDSYRRAIHRACETAFGMPKELRRMSKRISDDEQKKLHDQAAVWRAQHLWSPHQLRHSAATIIRRQFGLEAAQAALGHRRMGGTGPSG